MSTFCEADSAQSFFIRIKFCVFIWKIGNVHATKIVMK